MKRLACLMITCCLLVACGGSPELVKQQKFSAVPAGKRIYLVPFSSVMVPREVRAEVFDTFVDRLIAAGESRQYEYVILKQGDVAISPELRAESYLVRGELFAYVEESGCCNTTLRLRSRIKLFQPGEKEPTLLLEYPVERFFNHDYSTLELQRSLLARDISTTLADQLSTALAGG